MSTKDIPDRETPDRPRFEPYGGAGPLPTSCCHFAVVDNEKGVEICRVWDEDDARLIARLLEENRVAIGGGRS